MAFSSQYIYLSSRQHSLPMRTFWSCSSLMSQLLTCYLRLLYQQYLTSQPSHLIIRHSRTRSTRVCIQSKIWALASFCSIYTSCSSSYMPSAPASKISTNSLTSGTISTTKCCSGVDLSAYFSRATSNCVWAYSAGSLTWNGQESTTMVASSTVISSQWYWPSSCSAFLFSSSASTTTILTCSTMSNSVKSGATFTMALS